MTTTTDTHVFRAFAPALRDTGLPAGVIGQVSGIALVYDTLDSYGTTFAEGSLDRTRREKVAAGKVKLFWDHGKAPMNDGMYDTDLHIGTVKSLEDVTLPDGKKAAMMVADIFDTEEGRAAKQYLAAVLSSGGDTGLSVGFRPRGETKMKGGVIRFDEIELREISVTAMQAVPDAEVMSVRHEGHTMRLVVNYANVADAELVEKIRAAVADGTLVATAMVEVDEEAPSWIPAEEPTEDGAAVVAETLAPETPPLEVKDRPSLEAALDALLYALPVDVIRAHVGAVLGNADSKDSDAAGPTPTDSNAEAEDSRTTDPVVFATMDERLLALRQSYAEAA